MPAGRVYTGGMDWGTYPEVGAPPEIEEPPTDNQCVVEFARKRLQFEPDERQTEVLRSGAKREF